MFAPQSVLWACNNSQVSLLNYTDNGATHDYEIQVCIGGGILGVNQGADNDTKTFAIAVYKSGSTVTLSGATPSITSTETGVTMNSTTLGPLGAPFNSEEAIGFIHMGGTSFTCISSTALCGNPHADCFTINFTSDVSLDSIRVFGLEGNGNPIAGCTYNSDMKLDFVTPLPVELAEFSGKAVADRIILEWNTFSEVNHDFFTVEHRGPRGDFQPVAFISGNGGPALGAQYQFIHHPLAPGIHYYRLAHTDLDGNITLSPVITVQLEELPVTLYSLVPGKEYSVQVSEGSELQRVSLLNMEGRILASIQPSGSGCPLNLTEFPAGLYWVRVTTGKNTLTLRVPRY